MMPASATQSRRCEFSKPSYSFSVLPEEITGLRAQMGWSMSRLAMELGVRPDLVVDWESGERFPTKKHHEALASLRARAHENE